MKQGTLMYDSSQDRLYILTDDGEEIYLHCGDCLRVKTGEQNGDWAESRAEYSMDAWYLVGLYRSGEIPCGLTVQAYT